MATDGRGALGWPLHGLPQLLAGRYPSARRSRPRHAGLEERRAKLRELQRSCHPDKHRRSVPAIEEAASKAFQHLTQLAQRAGLTTAKTKGAFDAARDRVYTHACSAGSATHHYPDGRQRPDL